MPDIDLTQTTLLIALMCFGAAVLYSSVGHAGASGYLAAMALGGVAPGVMKPTALVLNLFVASLTTFRFYRAGHFSWRLLWPFVLGSVPLAFVGGALVLPGSYYKPVVGAVLVFAAWTFAFRKPGTDDKPTVAPPVVVAVGIGAVIGLLSGLTGTGGGIFLSPLIIALAWADPRTTGGISAAFILLNSAAGLAGNLGSTRMLPAQLPVYVLAVATGGLLGSTLGSRRLSLPLLRKLLALVLLIAGLKLLFT